MQKQKLNSKDTLLNLLENNRGRYFSGEELANELGISRSMIWKNISLLRSEGYNISAANNRGYCLEQSSDVLTESGIRKYLSANQFDINVVHTIESTNAYVQEQALRGKSQGFVVLADEQTDGKGRCGRSFYSPNASGLYMSVLLQPSGEIAKEPWIVTIMTAVAMCETIEELTGKSAKIKWFNDIFVEGKKVCGILTQGTLDIESGLTNNIVLGVGLNVYKPIGGFPAELSGVAGWVCDDQQEDMKNKLAAVFLQKFWSAYTQQLFLISKEKYRKRSLVIGKKLTLIDGVKKESVTCIDVDDRCRLVVTDWLGKEKTISFGNISIRLEN